MRWTGPEELQNAYAGVFWLDGESFGKRAGMFEAWGDGEMHVGVEARANGAITTGFTAATMA